MIEPSDELPPAAAIRARYAAKLKDPREWLRLVRGGVDLRKLLGGLSKISTTSSQVHDPFAHDVLTAIAAWTNDATILLARGDNTAVAFQDAARGVALACSVETCETASHSFARMGDAAWLEEQIVTVLMKP